MSKRSILVPLAALAMIFGAGSAFANSLDVNNAAAIGGTFGLEVITDSTSTPAFVATTAPDGEVVVRGEFRIRHNNLSMDNGTGHVVLMGRNGPAPVVNNLRLFMRRANDEYKITFRAKKDGPGTAFCGKTTMAALGLRVGFELVSASPGMSNGECRLIRNGVVVFNRTDLENETQDIDAFRFGAVNGVSATTSGSYYLDDFSSFRTLAP